MRQEDWTVYTWYCINCSAKVQGYKNPEGRIKCTCKRCGTVMVRTIKSRRHDQIDTYAAPGFEHRENRDYIPEFDQ